MLLSESLDQCKDSSDVEAPVGFFLRTDGSCYGSVAK